MGDTSDNDDHDALLAAVADGNVGALERLYRDLRVAVFGVALAILGDGAAAEDVLHDTFVRVHDNAARYRPGTRPRAWIMAIARNLALDAVRRRARERVAHAPAAAEEPRESLSWREALMTLEPREREIVALHLFGELTHAEIAAELAVPPGTIRWKYRTALARLAPLYAEARDA